VNTTAGKLLLRDRAFELARFSRLRLRMASTKHRGREGEVFRVPIDKGRVGYGQVIRAQPQACRAIVVICKAEALVRALSAAPTSQGVAYLP
jgi:hypothetical protein